MPIDFLGMTDNRDLFVVGVVQKVFVSVDKACAEAAAATAVIMELTVAPEDPCNLSHFSLVKLK